MISFSFLCCDGNAGGVVGLIVVLSMVGLNCVLLCAHDPNLVQ